MITKFLPVRQVELQDGPMLGLVKSLVRKSEGGEVRALRLDTVWGPCEVKLHKNVRCYAEAELTEGAEVRLWIRKGKIHMFVPLKPKSQVSPPCRTQCITVCNSKHCCRRGGDEILERLQEECKARGEQSPRVKTCGCLGRCRKGPIVKVAGEGVQALRVRDLDGFLDRHFPTNN